MMGAPVNTAEKGEENRAGRGPMPVKRQTKTNNDTMNRRKFLTIAGVSSLLPLGVSARAAEETTGRNYYELRQYQFTTDDQRKGFDTFMREAAIPAINRLGIQPVGVFYPEKDPLTVYALLPHRSLELLVSLRHRLAENSEFAQAGSTFLDAPASAPAYKRFETSLLLAFTGMPELNKPAKGPGRVFQLRTYESPSVRTNLKKIEMFNKYEIAIFRKVGLNPVFFGEMLVGSKMPNLTYMLGFESMDEQKAGWKNFGASPDWQRLRAMPEYADKNILCGITNIVVKPTEYSQI